MDAAGLRKDILPDNRLVGRNPDSGERFHQFTDAGNLLLINPERQFQMVFQNSNHTGNRCIPCPLTQTVNRGMYPLYAGTNRSKGVGYREIVVVVRVKVEMQRRIAICHSLAESKRLIGRKYPQRIGKHKPKKGFVLQCIEYIVHIVGRSNHSIAPVFQIDVGLHPLFCHMQQCTPDVGNVLLGGFA